MHRLALSARLSPLKSDWPVVLFGALVVWMVSMQWSAVASALVMLTASWAFVAARQESGISQEYREIIQVFVAYVWVVAASCAALPWLHAMAFWEELSDWVVIPILLVVAFALLGILFGFIEVTLHRYLPPEEAWPGETNDKRWQSLKTFGIKKAGLGMVLGLAVTLTSLLLLSLLLRPTVAWISKWLWMVPAIMLFLAAGVGPGVHRIKGLQILLIGAMLGSLITIYFINDLTEANSFPCFNFQFESGY